MDDCVFCKIASGAIPTTVLFQNDDVMAFPDAHPKAPIHVLVIPKKHVQSLNQVTDVSIVCNMIDAAKQVAKDKGIYEKGYKLVINTGKEGGQVIQHLHLHLIGGKLFEV